MNNLTPEQLDDLERLEKEANQGKWKYNGMIGDLGEPLRHVMESNENTIFLSEEFNVDYSGGERNFNFIAALRNHAKALIAAARELNEIEEMLDQKIGIAVGDEHRKYSIKERVETLGDIKCFMDRRFDESVEENQRLRRALFFYSISENYTYRPLPTVETVIEIDKGSKANAALEGK